MRKYAIFTVFFLLLLFALLQTASIKKLSSDTAALEEVREEIVEERKDLLQKQEAVIEQIAIIGEPDTGTEEPPIFEPLNMIPLDHDLQFYIWGLCEQYEVPYEIVIAVIEHESGFNPAAIGYNANGTQDSGLMQINDINKGWLAESHEITDLFDPYQCTEAGIIMLSMFWHYGSEAALTAYALGEAGMIQSGSLSPFAIDILEMSKEYLLDN